MEIKRVGSQPSGKGPADWFTGVVRIDLLHTAPEPARVGMGSLSIGEAGWTGEFTGAIKCDGGLVGPGPAAGAARR